VNELALLQIVESVDIFLVDEADTDVKLSFFVESGVFEPLE
jgi:hypothetical protein